MATLSVPPMSVEPAGGWNSSVSLWLGWAAIWLPSDADIGTPAEQCVLLPSPSVVVPWVNADHPSVGAADPSGFAHETSIHVPARAGCAPMTMR